MKRLLVALCGLVLLAGCGQSKASPMAQSARKHVGKWCEVQFRRDALGAAADLPIPPATTNINGASVTISGKLKALDDNWLELGEVDNQDEKTLFLIPTHGILMLRFP
jgi:hypothetical protein